MVRSPCPTYCLLALLLSLAACAPNPPLTTAPQPTVVPPAPVPAAAASAVASPQVAQANEAHYRCDQGIEFNVRFADGSATVDAGARGNDVLLRDAGGTTPQQTVYSNTRMRAEFGLGANGAEAILHYASPALETRCARG